MTRASRVSLFCLLFASICVAVSCITPNPKCISVLPDYLADLDAGRTPAEPLPIPPSSIAPVIRNVGYNLEEIREGVYTVHTGVYYSMIVFRGKNLVLIDSPDPDGSAATANTTVTANAAVEVLNGEMPTKIDIVYSHSHFDHIGAAATTKKVLQRKYPNAVFRVWASEGTFKSLLQAKSARAPLPNCIFRKRAVLRVGKRGRSMPVYLAVVGGHTEDDILVYFKRSPGQKGIAFLVDVVIPGWAPSFYFTLSQNLNQYIAVHDLLLKLDYDVLVGGHISRIGTRKDVEISKQYTNFALDAARKAQREATPLPQLAQSLGMTDPKKRAFGNWLLVTITSFNRVERACARAVIAEWGCKLAGVEAVALTNCVTARWYVTIDI